MSASITTPSSLLLTLYQSALQAVDGAQATAAWLGEHPWQPDMPLALFACGKAAPAMAQGAQAVLGERLEQALLVTKRGYLPGGWPAHWQCLESGHPVPDAASLAAGERLLDWLADLPDGMPLLVLISGGTSALLERLPPGVTLADWQRANTWLLGSGADIGEMNRVRKALSCLKGGKLAGYLGPRPVLNLLISDVPGDDPAIIGSGLLGPAGNHLPDGLPPWLAQLTRQQAACPPGVAGEPVIEQHIVASNRDACEAVAEQARQQGLAAWIHPPLFMPVEAAAEQITDVLREAPTGIHIWGGEPTLTLPEHPGRGGRNQHLALSLAVALEGESSMTVLCGASDGSDGPGEDAGALIDGTTVNDVDYPGGAAQALARADSGGFLDEAGALLSTGPTGTNVMDLVIALKH